MLVAMAAEAEAGGDDVTHPEWRQLTLLSLVLKVGRCKLNTG